MSIRLRANCTVLNSSENRARRLGRSGVLFQTPFLRGALLGGRTAYADVERLSDRSVGLQVPSGVHPREPA